MKAAARLLLLVLETATLALLVALALVVVYAVAMRTIGASPGWYDEIAANMLAWITWLGAAYAALRGSHMTVQSLLVRFPPSLRRVLFLAAEVVVVVTMIFVAIAGWKIVRTLSGESLVSLSWMSRALLQSVLPVGAVLFIAGRLLTLKDALAQVMAGTDADAIEIASAIGRAEEMHGSARVGGSER